MALIVAIGSLAVRAFGLTKAANYAISLAAAAMEMAMVDLADAMMGLNQGQGRVTNVMKTLTHESNAGAAARSWAEKPFIGPLADVATASAWSNLRAPASQRR